ncbi:MAG: hypothetical protein WCP93_00610 [Candidatus Berkelbacteria bacterium]
MYSYLLRYGYHTRDAGLVFEEIGIFTTVELAVVNGINKHTSEGTPAVKVEDLTPHDKSLAIDLRGIRQGFYTITPFVTDVLVP